ncbi:SunI/YnzG family protein [Bacillus cereus]
MKEIEIIKSKETMTIIWQSAMISIPLEDILKVYKNNNNITDTIKVVNIGKCFQHSEHIFIRTKKLDYLLFTTNKLALLNKINL